MSKYIDAEKLIAEIERRIDSWSTREKNSPVGQGKDTCVSRVTELTDLLSFIDSLQQGQSSLPVNLDEAAEEQTRSFGYQKEDYEYKELIETFKAGASFAVQRIISLIESRIAEILGDAQPAPILRTELQELIDKIKEESK